MKGTYRWEDLDENRKIRVILEVLFDEFGGPLHSSELDSYGCSLTVQ
jgi:hypothetical protein